MESVFISVTMAFGVCAILVMASIVRDVMPNLSEEEQSYFRHWFKKWGTKRFDLAVKKAWDLHLCLFPHSRKRVVLACVFVAALLSVFAYPFWRAIR